MNDYFKTFHNIAQSVEELLNSEHHSLEIKQYATKFKNSVKPCVEELKQSAIKLNQLVLVCSDELHHTENLWFSKPKIMEAAQQKIWEQLGEISGRSVKTSQIAKQFEDEAVKQAKQSWNQWIDYLINKWFVNEYGYKKGIGWEDKKGFIDEINLNVNEQYQKIDQIIKENLYLVFKETQATQVESFRYYINLLDQHKKAELSKQIELMSNEPKLINSAEHLPEYLPGLKTTVSPGLKALIDRGWSDIQRQSVINFKDRIALKIDKFITVIFADRVELVIEANTKAIKFYNDFLEQQERYQQETPEQREAEKAWIDQQRQELARLQDGIQVILNDVEL